MHIHVPTEKRYQPIDYVMTLGTITKIAMENLIAQMEGIDHKASGVRIEPANIEPGQIAVVASFPRGRHRTRVYKPGCGRHRRRRADDEPMYEGYPGLL